MDKQIEIKEEDPFTDDVTSQNEIEFFQKVASMKTSTDAVLLDTDCDMTIKTEIKSETPFIENLVNPIKNETATWSNNCEMDKTNEVEQDEGEFLPGHPEMMDNKYNSDHEMCNKIEFIEIKEEPWQLETETPSFCDNTEDVDLPPVESSRLHPETFAGASTDKSPLLSVELPLGDTGFFNGINYLECEYQKRDVTYDVPTANEYVHFDHYGSDEADRYIEPLHIGPRSLSPMSEGPPWCYICQKGFSCLTSLKRHVLIHQGKRPHKCKFCDRRFTQLGNLKTHVLLHEGKKPYECPVCDRSFARMSHLKAHILLHGGQRPHQCKVCNKGFTQLSHLRRHNVVHESKSTH